ncbi:hypothetical protein PGTUg99_020956 [Puccinia graminis f. sp. tritici]|uniref:Uncharacterized protein n=1 Tax=Puccinia graminis f. sp. tritici TaxID=56615 RepID=A0A5B0RZV3_PUCGR|nr:hypothetical protein PGTUg99_020956 [Puccinia graminis f. sp. tritici]
MIESLTAPLSNVLKLKHHNTHVIDATKVLEVRWAGNKGFCGIEEELCGVA